VCRLGTPVLKDRVRLAIADIIKTFLEEEAGEEDDIDHGNYTYESPL
jgi:hypothetical protein